MTNSDYSMEAGEVKVDTLNNPDMQAGSNQASIGDGDTIIIMVKVHEEAQRKAEKAYRESWDNFEEDEEILSIVPFITVFIILMVGYFMFYIFFSTNEEQKVTETKLRKEEENEAFPVSSMKPENQKLMKFVNSLNVLDAKKKKEACGIHIQNDHIKNPGKNKKADDYKNDAECKTVDLYIIKGIIIKTQKSVRTEETITAERKNTDTENAEIDEETDSTVEEVKASEFVKKNRSSYLSKFIEYRSEVQKAHENYENQGCLYKWFHSFYCDCCCKSKHQKKIKAIHENHAKNSLEDDKDGEYKTLRQDLEKKYDFKLQISQWEWRFWSAVFSVITSTVSFAYYYEQKKTWCSQAVISSFVSFVVFSFWTFYTHYKYKKCEHDEQAIII